MIYEFNGFVPTVHATAFVHPQASVTGNVTIGRDVYIGPSAAIRADWGEIIIEDGCNVQENCTLHMFPGTKVHLLEGAHIGHGAVIHGATIGRNCLVGMNAVVMDNVILGAECIVGALSFVAGDQTFEDRQLIVGNPAKAVKKVSDKMMAWKTKGTALYQQLPADCHQSLQPVQPARSAPKFKPEQEALFKTWGKEN